jgi:broad specificity phosphatase PhoE
LNNVNEQSKHHRRRIYLMRHGSVTYFTPDGVPLPPNDVPLNTNGIAEANAAGQLFGSHDINFDRVIVSGLPRTVETAAHVLLASSQSLNIEHRPALEEIKSGRLADIPIDDLRASFSNMMAGSTDMESRFLGGETWRGLFERVIPEIDAIRHDSEWNTLLMVLHGGVNRALLSYLLTGERRLIGGFEQSPASINVIDIGETKGDVVLRASNLSPTDWLQKDTRSTTMEMLLGQYAKHRMKQQIA